LAATTIGYEVCTEKSRYEVKPVLWKGIYLPDLYTISPTLKPLHDILLVSQQLLVQTEAQVLATVLFTQDYVKSGEALVTVLSCVSRLREVLV